MARGRRPRTWIKIDCEGILRGSINYLLSLECQAIWVKMIAYSEICGGRAGWIEDNNYNGLPHEYVAQELHCSIDLYDSVLDIMSKDRAIEVSDTGAVRLVNYDHYQFGDYDRQKPYREGQKEAEKVSSDSPKRVYGEFGNVLLTDIEYSKLTEKFGESGTNLRIEQLSGGIASKGYKYKSHYATILTWDRRDKYNHHYNKQDQQAQKVYREV